MKFGRAYKKILETGGFPSDWVNSAISYPKLKKCIKRVNKEIESLGLDAETLDHLLQQAREQEQQRQQHGENEGGVPHRPKLLFWIDEETEEPVDASLAPETRRYIRNLVVTRKLHEVQLSEAEGDTHVAAIHHDTTSKDTTRQSSIVSTSLNTGYSQDEVTSTLYPQRLHQRLIEVPLTSDTEFFQILQSSLSGLSRIQESERAKLSDEIQHVGAKLVRATDPTSKAGKADLDRWRRIFELYVDSRIFFAASERDRGTQRAAVAQERYAKFLATGRQAKMMEKFKTKESVVALKQFLAINVELLQHLQFQEVNQTAMVKILKKFDKRTSLPAPPATALTPATLSKTLSQHLSATISSSILSSVPALSDYLCPVCSELAWRPVRLACSHIFCIRCLIRLQKEKQDRCPLCRGDVVLKADSSCLDENLVRFMNLWFSREVKEKQKLNERLAREELYGPEWEAKCAVM